MIQSADERPIILIVEDEYLVRMATAEAIRDAGFDVVEATNSDGALAALEGRRGIRVVITEIDMQGSMDGAKLAHAVSHGWPKVRIIATSGHFAPNELDLPAGCIFFQKPYSFDDIVWTLRALTQLD
jgi:DNA-binding NtrC family response regulator